MLLNLQSNALKFTPADGSVKIICTRIRSEHALNHSKHSIYLERCNHGLLQIEVKDTGTGISVEDQGKLFKLFGFLSKTQHINTKGIGLGLYISKMIVEKFGGNIGLKSEVDVGSQFTFVIALEKTSNAKTKINRIRNPESRKSNPKFTLEVIAKLGHHVEESKFASDQS